MSNRTSIKYPGTTTSTSEIHINNMYIRYTFLLDVAVLQIRQVLWAIPLLVTFSLAVKALSIRLRSSLGLLRRRGNFLTTLLEVSLLLRLAFLEFGGLIDQQHLVLFLGLHLQISTWQRVLATSCSCSACCSSSQSSCNLVVVIGGHDKSPKH